MCCFVLCVLFVCSMPKSPKQSGNRQNSEGFAPLLLFVRFLFRSRSTRLGRKAAENNQQGTEERKRIEPKRCIQFYKLILYIFYIKSDSKAQTLPEIERPSVPV